MSKSSEVRSSAVDYDGAALLVINSGLVTLSTAQTDNAPFVMPCDGTIVQATARVTVAAGTATATLTIGTQASDVGIMDKDFATTDGAGEYDCLADLVTATVTKGDIILFGSDGNATSTGLVAITLVVSPNAA